MSRPMSLVAALHPWQHLFRSSPQGQSGKQHYISKQPTSLGKFCGHCTPQQECSSVVSAKADQHAHFQSLPWQANGLCLSGQSQGIW